VKKYNCKNISELIQRAKYDRSTDLRSVVVDAMTTNETLWFRDVHPFEMLTALLIPECLKSRTEARPIRIWSAASSTGQEAYSIAICIREFCERTSRVTPEEFEIIGTDISPSALAAARTGLYDSFAMSRGLDPKRRDRFFKAEGLNWRVKPELQRMVTFKHFNLLQSPIALGLFDLIFCRNVAIYFDQPAKEALFNRLTRALHPGGYLLIGSAESLVGMTTQLKMVNWGRSVCYQRLAPADRTFLSSEKKVSGTLHYH
jgi:chemotaxis protein methyltransferase CheR